MAKNKIKNNNEFEDRVHEENYHDKNKKNKNKNKNIMYVTGMLLFTTAVSLSISLPLTIGVKNKIKLEVNGLSDVDLEYIDFNGVSESDDVYDAVIDAQYVDIGKANSYSGAIEYIQNVNLYYLGIANGNLKYNSNEISYNLKVKEAHEYFLNIDLREDISFNIKTSPSSEILIAEKVNNINIELVIANVNMENYSDFFSESFDLPNYNGWFASAQLEINNSSIAHYSSKASRIDFIFSPSNSLLTPFELSFDQNVFSIN